MSLIYNDLIDKKVTTSAFRFLLLPLSWLYGIAVWIRNVLFNAEILPSTSYDMPVISVGNITVGGTGKTPHTEYLIRALSNDYQVAVLSRGYKRKSKGFVLADATTGLADLGDEPLQMKRKFPNLIVAVDENRRRGIETLMSPKMQPFIEVILLDDAYQHRYVNPSISILMIDYNRLIREDYLLPVGNLREPAAQMKRAQMVIVSKCPTDLTPMDVRILDTKIGVLPYQSLYFTTMKYGPIEKLVPSAELAEKKILVPSVAAETSDAFIETEAIATEVPIVGKLQSFEQIKEQRIPILLLTGIATPQSLESHVRLFAAEVKAMHFADHHEFSKRDARKIGLEFETIKDAGGIILTTEKDATRIRNNPFMQPLAPHIYYPTLEINFLEGQGRTFEQKITDYVRINKRNRKLS
ncbi:MAG: tetraacyldisaccharide 4'-kinase [Bacteroidia bacterium]|nr:tetraacyldisaccharide 4'-kinase [Bacteroidia bacterium]